MTAIHAAFSPQDMLILLVIVLVLFGGSKIPELARGLGQGMKEFKNATKEEPTPEEKPREEKDKPASV